MERIRCTAARAENGSFLIAYVPQGKPFGISSHQHRPDNRHPLFPDSIRVGGQPKEDRSASHQDERQEDSASGLAQTRFRELRHQVDRNGTLGQ